MVTCAVRLTSQLRDGRDGERVRASRNRQRRRRIQRDDRHMLVVGPAVAGGFQAHLPELRCDEGHGEVAAALARAAALEQIAGKEASAGPRWRRHAPARRRARREAGSAGPRAGSKRRAGWRNQEATGVSRYHSGVEVSQAAYPSSRRGPEQARRLHMEYLSTSRHCGERRRNPFQSRVLESTSSAHRSGVTRSNSGTCTMLSQPYIAVRRQRGRDRALLGLRLLMGPSGSLGEGADANKGTGVRRSQGTHRLG